MGIDVDELWEKVHDKVKQREKARTEEVKTQLFEAIKYRRY